MNHENTNRQQPVCPVCGKACETIYYAGNDLLGCDNCIRAIDAENVDECFDEYWED